MSASVWVTTLDAGGLASVGGTVKESDGAHAQIVINPGEGSPSRGEEVLVTFLGITVEQRLGRVTEVEHGLLHVTFLERF